MEITAITAREILDSRGNPTIEADVILENGIEGRASVPSGASTGQFEASELRDGAKRYQGRGVQMAVGHIHHTIAPALLGYDVSDQAVIDARLCALDGTENKSHLGANAILAVSLAVARADALSRHIPLYEKLTIGSAPCMPIPMMNVINGGAHADNALDIQEFMIMPVGASSFPHALEMGHAVTCALRALLKQAGHHTAVGDEGGFAPSLGSAEAALDILAKAVETAGLSLESDIVFALDVAASEWFKADLYHRPSDTTPLDATALIDFYASLISQFPIVSLEDPLGETDWAGWKHLTDRLGQKVQLVGDDLFVTQSTLLQRGIDEGVANAILIKLNQVGTLTETLQTMQLAHANDYRCVVSHRSGETEDTFIADLAVGTGCGQIKTGALCRTDRIAKYNQLLRIQAQSGLPYAKRP